jgi:anthranilate phosphoribosyltransferase
VTLGHAIRRAVEGHDLSEAEMTAAMEVILQGSATPAQVAGFLVALRLKGETVDEVVAAARVMRAHATRIPGAPANAVDTCGTGGDGAGTLNVSTAAGLVVAATGVPVAKHGNRAVSGPVGGADVLQALGVRLDLGPEQLAGCLREVGFAFLFAPALHPALRHAAAARRELGVRTLFNLLGPLTNPAGVRRQVVGVFAEGWVEPVAEALLRLGTERAWVVHGAGGLDEVALAGETLVAEVADGRVRTRRVTAADAGLVPTAATPVRIESVDAAVDALRAVLAGERGPAREMVCLNAAAALVVAEAADDLRAGARRAAEAIDSGAAAGVLDRLVAFSTRHAPAGDGMGAGR